MSDFVEQVIAKIRLELGDDDDTIVECVDVSDSVCDGAKLELVVVSPKFEGMPLLKRHRTVNGCLNEYMDQIHALSIKAWTPSQYAKKKQKQQHHEMREGDPALTPSMHASFANKEKPS
eukprot:CAMPEP_0116823734 /NCGR_PEP_ID=MMETSP0418-20121206/1004_1 /TAXON_ID=1158023 /ORGANISM="Astrosyne radiata, Strain 13vi08-1A" /LENGTH=118 /DNA_ID=CAMNT_0004452023 /DNA_START=61 /DNA_END=415 /DNA_ORIENTATION=-